MIKLNNMKKTIKKTKNKKAVTSLKVPKKPTLKKDPLIIVEEKPKLAIVKEVKKPSFEKMYFTKDTEDAIIEYNLEVEIEKREIIYNTKIKYAFEKLVENVFNTFKFSYFDVSPLDVQKETLSHLVANMHKFEAGKGKAFAYFSIIAKHYLIFHNNSNYKRYKQQVDISEENEENTVRLQTTDKHHKNVEHREFMNMMIDFWDKNVNKIFTKTRDLNIAQAVIELFRNSDRIEAFNKKALYLYIREISNCKTQQITKILNKMKIYQEQITRSYVNSGVV
jgi:hypothetical protein